VDIRVNIFPAQINQTGIGVYTSLFVKIRVNISLRKSTKQAFVKIRPYS